MAGKKKTKSPPLNYAGVCTDSVVAEMKNRGRAVRYGNAKGRSLEGRLHTVRVVGSGSATLSTVTVLLLLVV